MIIKSFDKNNFAEFEQLAYKAVFERGFVDVDFNKQHWNIHLKNLLSYHNNIVRMAFDKGEVVGFYILQLHQLPWNHRTHGLFTLIHMAPNHRSLPQWQKLLDDAIQQAKDNDVTRLQTTDASFLMDNAEKNTLLHTKGFHLVDTIYEVNTNV